MSDLAGATPTPKKTAGPARVVAVLAAIAVVVVVAVVATRGDNTSSGNGATTTTTTAAAATTTSPPATTTPTAPAGPGTTVPPDGTVPTTGRFTIVGRQIVDPNGNVFVPMGANMAVRQGGFEEGYAFNWNGTGTGHSADVAAWGWNTVRASLICDVDGDPSADELNAGIDDFIAEYTAKHIVVMVECHDVTLDNLTPSDPKIQALYPFWDRLVEKWHTNPYVWFNYFNEPQGDATKAAVANWMSLQQEALARLRSVAPTSIFVADIPGGGQAVETFTGPNPITELGEGQCNVLYSWHAYGALGHKGTFGEFADYDDEEPSRANHAEALTYLADNDIPIVIGELGDPLTLDEGSAGQPIWNRIGAHAVMDFAPANGIGLLWWHATGDSGVFLTYSLMADRHQAPWSAATTGDGLSDGGRRFWEVSKAQPAPVPFTGDLAAGNCG